MAILGKLLKKGIAIRESLEQDYTSPIDLQKNELRKLLISAKDTYFGDFHYFNTILNGFKEKEKDLFYQFFKSNIPIFTYETIHSVWWSKSMEGLKDVCWPGKVKYYALSSGTSNASSKYIPVTKDMLKSIKKSGTRQLLALSKFDLEPDFFEKGMLMVGGSTNLKYNGVYYEGDLSGITTGKIPFWLQHFYKPGKKIAKSANWEDKLDEMVENAALWDIGIVMGVPAWIQILMERVIARYQLKNIHEIWPNLRIFVHGGVSFSPYRKGFEKLLAQPLIYLETYLASEGFIAFQSELDQKAMKLVLNNGIFYEFVPFNTVNFDHEGNIYHSAEALKIDEISEGVDYALLLSTNAGAWRYLIGDVIKFTSKEKSEIILTGRIKHFLSLCGEHLSMDNMNRAIQLTEDELNMHIKEFTVCGEKCETLFAHHWYIGTDDPIEVLVVKETLDRHLKMVNDDYAVERKEAIREVIVEILPTQIFYDWMKMIGKTGGQSKFPRVLSNGRLEDWKKFIGLKQEV